MEKAAGSKENITPATRMALKNIRKKNIIIRKENITPATRIGLKKMRKEQAYNDFWYKVIALSFFAIIFGLLILRLILPVPAISLSENRELKKMPPFNFQNIFFGKFTTEFEDYFADTFPLRDPFMDAGEYVSYLYKIPVSGVDSVVIMDQENEIGAEEFEDDEYTEQPSSTAQSPEETAVTNPLTGEGLGPTPEPTPEPTREPQQQNGVFLLTDTAIYKEIINNPKVYGSWAQGINRLARDLPGKRVMAMSPPNSFLFYANPEYFKPENDERAGIADLYAQLDDGIISIDTIPFLEQHKSEYIYFRTDMHWTARGAYCGYLAFCEQTGMTPLSLDEFEPNAIYPDFLGSYYKHVKNTAKAKIIKGSPDYIEYFVPPAEYTLTIYGNASMSGGKEGPMFDTDVEGKHTYYYLFLGDDYPCIKITTDTYNGRSILIYKDSFADALAPYLAAHYQTIYIVDHRDYNTSKLPKFKAADFVKNNDIDDVLCIMNFDFINVSDRVKLYLKAMPG